LCGKKSGYAWHHFTPKSYYMRILLLVLLSMHSYNSIAQKKLFIRLFDLQGRKITSGKISTWTDSSITIGVSANHYSEVGVAQIGIIKTKRSIGHNVAVGAILGGGIFAISGAASGETEPQGSWDFFYITPAEGAALGLLFGASLGAAVGGISGLFKNSQIYLIHGDRSKLKAFESTFTQQKN